MEGCTHGMPLGSGSGSAEGCEGMAWKEEDSRRLEEERSSVTREH